MNFASGCVQRRGDADVFRMRTTGIFFAVAIGALAIPRAPAQETIRNLAPIAGTAQRTAMSSVVPVQVSGTIPYPKGPADRLLATRTDAQLERTMTSIDRSELAAAVAAVGTIKATTAIKPRVASVAPKPTKKEKEMRQKQIRRILEQSAVAAANAEKPLADAGDASVIKPFTFSPLD